MSSRNPFPEHWEPSWADGEWVYNPADGEFYWQPGQVMEVPEGGYGTVFADRSGNSRYGSPNRTDSEVMAAKWDLGEGDSSAIRQQRQMKQYRAQVRPEEAQAAYDSYWPDEMMGGVPGGPLLEASVMRDLESAGYRPSNKYGQPTITTIKANDRNHNGGFIMTIQTPGPDGKFTTSESFIAAPPEGMKVGNNIAYNDPPYPDKPEAPPPGAPPGQQGSDGATSDVKLVQGTNAETGDLIYTVTRLSDGFSFDIDLLDAEILARENGYVNTESMIDDVGYQSWESTLVDRQAAGGIERPDWRSDPRDRPRPEGPGDVGGGGRHGDRDPNATGRRTSQDADREASEANQEAGRRQEANRRLWEQQREEQRRREEANRGFEEYSEQLPPPEGDNREFHSAPAPPSQQNQYSQYIQRWSPGRAGY